MDVKFCLFYVANSEQNIKITMIIEGGTTVLVQLFNYFLAGIVR